MQHIPHGTILSTLQNKILRLICTTRDVNYTTLIQETKRDRTTILQSVESLIKHGLIEKQKINPEYEKSKLIFKATNTGKQIARSHLGVNLEDIMKLEDDEQIANYLEFIKDITDPLQRNALQEPLSDLLTSPRAWISEDKTEADEETLRARREILRDAFRESLMELFKNKKYNVKDFLNNKNVKQFKKLFTPEEIKEIREYIQQIVDNASLTLERFPL